MKWIGTWTGKKVVKGEMSERVKKILASQEWTSKNTKKRRKRQKRKKKEKRVKPLFLF
jgi:hypothetical protein